MLDHYTTGLYKQKQRSQLLTLTLRSFASFSVLTLSYAVAFLAKLVSIIVVPYCINCMFLPIHCRVKQKSRLCNRKEQTTVNSEIQEVFVMFLVASIHIILILTLKNLVYSIYTKLIISKVVRSCLKQKKKKGNCFLCVFYGRFLRSNSASNKPTITIATIMPATAGTKYMSATDSAGASVGAGVGAASSTANAVEA